MAAAAQARRFVSPAFRAAAQHRLAGLAGLLLGIAGLVLLVALASYDPRDPSLNTATARAPANLAGPGGAAFADLALQVFGLAAVLPGLALLAWGWRAAAGRGFGSLAARLLALLLAVPALAAFATTTLRGPDGVPAWPATAGPGGAAGLLLGEKLDALAGGGIGPVGASAGGMAAWCGLGVLAAALALLSLGLTGVEWRAARGGVAWAARLALRCSRGAAGLLSRAAAGVARPRDPAADARPEPSRPATPVRVAPVLPVAPSPAASSSAAPPPELASSDLAPPRPAPASAPAPAPKRARDPVPSVPEPPRSAVQVGAPPPDSAGRTPPPADPGWQYPPLSLLTPPPRRQHAGPSEDALQANARLLETVLGDYGVQGAIGQIRPGPVVTLYELEPAPGIRSARVIGLADDIARSLCVTAVRIATVPGRNVIGIEVPNEKRETVYLAELLGSPDWADHPGRLALALGKDIGGTPVVADLARMPHLLIAGTTGSGKSVGINAMILSLLYRLSPDQCRLIMIDPKMLELSVYEGIPHLMAPVVTEPSKAVTALKWTVREMERRYRAMSQLGVRNVGGYNDRVNEARARGEVVTRRVQTGFDAETGKPTFEEQPLALEPLPFIVLVMDEMADLMMVAGKEVEACVQRLAQMARAAGIHVIMATQRPSVDVITGTIKANFPTRISFQVISKFDSRTILGEQGAEQLLGQGDLLHMQGGGRIGRVHGPFVADREVEEIVAFLRAQGEPAYLDEVTEASDGDDDGANSALSGIAAAGDGEKGLFDQAVDVVTREGKASTSFIQRHLSIGYNRAAKLIEQMEKEGIVSPANHVGKREVLARRTGGDDE